MKNLIFILLTILISISSSASVVEKYLITLGYHTPTELSFKKFKFKKGIVYSKSRIDDEKKLRSIKLKEADYQAITKQMTQISKDLEKYKISSTDSCTERIALEIPKSMSFYCLDRASAQDKKTLNNFLTNHLRL